MGKIAITAITMMLLLALVVTFGATYSLGKLHGGTEALRTYCAARSEAPQ